MVQKVHGDECEMRDGESLGGRAWGASPLTAVGTSSVSEVLDVPNLLTGRSTMCRIILPLQFFCPLIDQ